MATTCGNCGTTQGPFDRAVVGTRTMPMVLVTCGTGGRSHTKGLKPEERLAFLVKQTKACLQRRAILDGVN